MTPFRGFTAILYKEFLVVFRDPLTLFFMFFPPLIQLIAFGFALDTDVKHMATVVLDEDRTAESRAAGRPVREHADLPRRGRGAAASTELAAAIRRGQAYVGLQIPPGLHARPARRPHGARPGAD